MSTMTEFWKDIDERTQTCVLATSAQDVLELFPPIRDLGSGDGFYEGDGDELLGVLFDANWNGVDVRAGYWWCLQAPNGDQLTYCEGDLYAGNSMPKEVTA